MRRSRKPIVIASRRSRLARVQAEIVAEVLGRLHSGIRVEFRWIESEGDRRAEAVLANHGGKGLYTRAIEEALLRNEADLAVHSLKDLPARITPGLVLAAVPQREDVRDCLIARQPVDSIDGLPPKAVVGTTSPRRAAQVLRLRPDLRIAPLRGNVETRLRRVLGSGAGEPASEHGAGRYDATFLAVAGLERLGRTDLIQHAIDTEQMLPAACQGALAIQCRADDHVTLTRCLPLNDASSATAVHAERQVVSSLSVDCHDPVAVLAEPLAIDPASVKTNADAHWFRLRVRVLSSDGRTCLEANEQVRTKDLRRLVKQVVNDLTDRGVRRVLASSRGAALRDRARPMDATPMAGPPRV